VGEFFVTLPLALMREVEGYAALARRESDGRDTELLAVDPTHPQRLLRVCHMRLEGRWNEGAPLADDVAETIWAGRQAALLLADGERVMAPQQCELEEGALFLVVEQPEGVPLTTLRQALAASEARLPDEALRAVLGGLGAAVAALEPVRERFCDLRLSPADVWLGWDGDVRLVVPMHPMHAGRASTVFSSFLSPRRQRAHLHAPRIPPFDAEHGGWEPDPAIVDDELAARATHEDLVFTAGVFARSLLPASPAGWSSDSPAELLELTEDLGIELRGCLRACFALDPQARPRGHVLAALAGSDERGALAGVLAGLFDEERQNERWLREEIELLLP
jgi:hypothetical protein